MLIVSLLFIVGALCLVSGIIRSPDLAATVTSPTQAFTSHTAIVIGLLVAACYLLTLAASSVP